KNEEAMLAAKIRDAESAMESARIDAALGKTPAAEQPIAETTFGDQIPQRDHAGAVKDLLDIGVRPQTLEALLKTGHPDAKPDDLEEVQALAKEWERRLLNDAEKQKKFLAKDPEVMKEFAHFGVYRRDRRREPSE